MEECHLKPFKVLQQNEANIKTDFYHHTLNVLHFQRQVAETRTFMCWPLLSSYYLENWVENTWFGLSEYKLSSTNQSKFPVSISIWN